MAKPNFPQIAVIGNFRHNEFRDVVDHLYAKARAIYFDEMSQWTMLEDSARFDLFLLLESFPGEFLPASLERLQGTMPWSRLVMIAGSLAEGERRSGTIPSCVFRYYQHQWETEAAPEFDAYCEQKPGVWNLPPTSSEDERMLMSVQHVLARKKQQPSAYPKPVLVIADDPEMACFLNETLKKQGFFPLTSHGTSLTDSSSHSSSQNDDLFLKPTNDRPMDDASPTGVASRPEAVFYDVIEENIPCVLEKIRQLRTRWPKPVSLTVFYNAPHADEAALLKAAGVDHLISKPFQQNEFYRCDNKI